MAGSSLLTLIDDIATVLDDVALMTKVAAKKTAGVLGDDLALNAQQVTGVKVERELPVVWKVAVGSLRNKAILVPAALAISALMPLAIMPILMLGGAYLCFEGFEKLAHKYLHSEVEKEAHHSDQLQALADPDVDLVAFEQDKIKGAIRTDFILSAEIIVISLGTVATASFLQQLTVLVGIALVMTFGVYGLVAGIVKLDDAGLYLSQRNSVMSQTVGRALLLGAPYLMKTLSVVGTAAMFMVGGGILTHGVPQIHHAIIHLAEGFGTLPFVGGVAVAVMPMLLDAVIGVIVGALLLVLVKALVPLMQRLKSKP